MSGNELENVLRDLPRIGTLVKDRGYRQIWRFEKEGQGYYFKFYPRRLSLKRIWRGSPALREFFRLQWLQKAGVPAPRAVAVLNGFRLNGQAGDAVVIEAIEPSVGLDEYLNRFQLQGLQAPDHHALSRQIIQIVFALGAAQLGHSDLHLGNFLLKDARLHLIDAHAVHGGGLRLRDVLQLAHAVRSYATRADLLRGWRALKSQVPLPTRNPISRRWWRQAARRAMGENRYFGKWRPRESRSVLAGTWFGHYFKQCKYPQRWSAASGLRVSMEDWQRAWPPLHGQIQADQLQVIKRSRSGDVFGGQLSFGERTIPVIIKRPRRKHWHRFFNEIGRGSRSRRAWKKAWSLIARDIPTAWPLLLMERRILGYVVEQIILFERVEGVTLAQCDLDAMTGDQRDRLFRRTGRILRQMEQTDLYHYDAKPSNWIVRPDAVVGPSPMAIDVDGIRRIRWIALGIQRLLRGMRDNVQYTPADSLSLCLGYAPFAELHQDEPDEGEEPLTQEIQSDREP